MKVIVDAHMVGARETGNETYVVNLVQGLARFSSLEVTAAMYPGYPSPKIWNNRVNKLNLPTSSDWLRLAHGLPRACQQQDADLLHVTYAAPFWLPCPLVVSVHDVSFQRFPEFFSLRDRLVLNTLLLWTLRRAAAVLTISEHAKAEIVSAYPFTEGKVHVTPLAPARAYRTVRDVGLLRTVRRRYGIDSQFILAVGNLQPRKNLPRLLRAFSSVVKDLDDTQLVVVGKDKWQSSNVYTLAKELGIERRVIFTGYVSIEDLRTLYTLTDLFVYPSLYEGFGLPILEAMACGAPVVCSNTTSMPEVAGEAAVLVNPYDEEALASAILRVLKDSEFADYLSSLGLKWSEMYDWEDTAARTVEIYETIIL